MGRQSIRISWRDIAVAEMQPITPPRNTQAGKHRRLDCQGIVSSIPVIRGSLTSSVNLIATFTDRPDSNQIIISGDYRVTSPTSLRRGEQLLLRQCVLRILRPRPARAHIFSREHAVMYGQGGISYMPALGTNSIDDCVRAGVACSPRRVPPGIPARVLVDLLLPASPASRLLTAL